MKDLLKQLADITKQNNTINLKKDQYIYFELNNLNSLSSDLNKLIELCKEFNVRVILEIPNYYNFIINSNSTVENLLKNFDEFNIIRSI